MSPELFSKAMGIVGANQVDHLAKVRDQWVKPGLPKGFPLLASYYQKHINYWLYLLDNFHKGEFESLKHEMSPLNVSCDCMYCAGTSYLEWYEGSHPTTVYYPICKLWPGHGSYTVLPKYCPWK
jgi:hypothetical protein